MNRSTSRKITHSQSRNGRRGVLFFGSAGMQPRTLMNPAEDFYEDRGSSAKSFFQPRPGYQSIQLKPKAAKPNAGVCGNTPGKHIMVLLGQNKAFVCDGGRVIHNMPIKGGRTGHPTHKGNFVIDGSRRDIHHTSSEYGKCGNRSVSNGKAGCRRGEIYTGAPMPYFQPFNGSEGFHVGSLSVASHGCIHLDNSDAVWLFNNTGGGTRVNVQ